MKKSILFLLALFSVTMTTQAVDYYYRGSQNNWGATKITGNTGANGLFYYYKASASTSHEFKVTDNNNSNWSGNNWGTDNYVDGYNGADVKKQTSNDNCKVNCNSEHYILLYVGNNGKTPVVCASKTLPNGLNTVWVKHNWGGTNWSYKQATKNADGTFSVSAKYGETGCNLNAYNGENAQWWYDVADMNVEAGLKKGDEAVFTVDPVTRKISVTKKVNKNIGSVTVTMACAQQPNIYYFGGVDGATTYPDWPGVKMNDNGNGTYSYKVDNVDLDLGLDYVITLKEVNENEWKSGDLNARADVNHDASILNITSIAMHGNFSGGWKDSEYYSVNDENYNSATLKMTIEKGSYEFGMRIGASDNWTSNGKTFTRTNSSYVVKAGSGNLKLTADMTGEYEFKWTYKTNTLEIVFPEEEVVVSHTYTVVGSSPELFTNAWSPAETANNMEKQTDGSYKKVYNNIELTSDVEWKIAKDGTWWDETPLENKAANGNSVLTISKSGIYNVTFTLSADLKTAHAEAELLEETNTVADCFVSGNAALTGGAGWAGNEFKMEYDPATETYSYTLTGLAAETAYELQVVLGGNWYGYEKLQTIPTGVENKEGHIAFTLAEAGDVTITYHATNGINLTGNFAEPAPEVSVTLYFVNADKWTNLKAHIWVDPSGVSYKPWEESESLTDTDNDHNGADIYSYTFSNKYNRIIWKGDDGKQTADAVATYDVAKPYYCQGVWYASLSEIPAEPAEVKYVLMGINDDWTNGIPMTVNPDNANEYVLKGQVIAKATDALKVVTITNGAQTAWCGLVDEWSDATYELVDDGFGGKNIVLEDGIYDFYFKVSDSKIYIDQTGYARNVTNTYGTICLPYASASTAGATFFEVVGQETGKVYLASVTSLTAGVPYIFEKNQSATQIKVVYTGDKEDAASSANGLIGTFVDETAVPANNYILYGGKLCPTDGTAKVNAYRAYLDMSQVPEGAPQQMPGRRYIGMSVQGENETTGVEDIFTTDAPVKVIENGQLIIIRDGVKYNVQGQKL